MKCIWKVSNAEYFFYQTSSEDTAMRVWLGISKGRRGRGNDLVHEEVVGYRDASASKNYV